jgi:hypothetical protein
MAYLILLFQAWGQCGVALILWKKRSATTGSGNKQSRSANTTSEDLVMLIAINGGLGFCTSRRAARWGNARHCPKHAATRLPPAGAPETHADFFASGAYGTKMRHWLSARRKATANDSSSSKVHRREG